MIGKVSFYQTFNDIRSAIGDNAKTANKLSNQLSTQTRVQELRDDPMAASHASRYHSNLARKEVFVQQNREVYDTYQFSEGLLRQAVDILHNSRDLAVRAANGTFDSKDREYMAKELDQYIEELAVVVNSQDADGRYLFGGTRSNVQPFRMIRNVTNRDHKEVVTNVEYIGSNRANQTEISDKDVISRSIPGSELFWSQKTLIVGQREVLGYSVAEDSVITLNNVDIKLSRGDSVQSIVKKINESPASMTASINGFTGRLELIGTETRQAWISDTEGQVMTDLGIINDTSSAPYNISGDTNAFEETVFDTIIALRDSMYKNDYDQIGGRVLASIDKSMDALLSGLGKVGAISSRLDMVYRRIEEKDIPEITRQLDAQIAIDVADTMVKWQETISAQQASYQVSSQVMQHSLLNYLK